MLKPVVRETVTMNIIRQIRSMIQSGQYQPGMKIPSERELTKTFSVSRISVREAIKSLEASGLLEIRPGEGTFVKTFASYDLIDPLTSAMIIKHALKDLIEVRRIVEVEIAGFAAIRATEEKLNNLKKTLAQMESDIACKKSHYKSDREFHDALADSADNELLTRMINTVRDLMSDSIFLSTKVDGANYRAYNGHRQVYERIVEKDSDGAKAAMLEHLRQVEEDLFTAQVIVLGASSSKKDSKSTEGNSL